MFVKRILTTMAIISGVVLSALADEATAPASKDGKDNPKKYRTLDGSCYCCRNYTIGGAIDGYWGTVESLKVDANKNTANIKFKCGAFMGKEKTFQIGNQVPDGMDPKSQYVFIKKSDDGTLKVYFLPKEPSTPEEFQAARKAKKAFYYDDALSTVKLAVDLQDCQTCKGTGKVTQKVTENVKSTSGSGKNAKTVEIPKTVNKTEKCTKCNGIGTISVEWTPHVICTLPPQT